MIRRAVVLVPVACLMGFVFASADSTAPPSAPQPTPQLATLQGAHLPMSEALKTLTAQTSNPVADLMGAPDPFVDVDLQKVPFWDALDALADKAGGRVDLHSRDGIALVPRPPGWHPPPVSRDGLFRTALSSLTSRLDLESDTRTCIASVEVAWEPRLLPLLLETRPRSLRVVDDAGRSIPSGAVTSSLAPVDGRDSLSFDLALPAVSRAVKTLSLAQGDFYAIAPTKMLAFSFGPLDQLRSAGPDNPLVRSTQEGVVCRVSKVTAADDHWSVQITLDYPEGNVKLDSYQSWVVNNEIRLEDEAGDRFLSDTYLLEESTAEHAVLTYHFNDKERVKRGLSAWKVVYRTPALVVKVPIRFAFKDVPLP